MRFPADGGPSRRAQTNRRITRQKHYIVCSNKKGLTSEAHHIVCRAGDPVADGSAIEPSAFLAEPKRDHPSEIHDNG